MVRIIVNTDDCGMAVNIGGSVHTFCKSFEIDHPELERYLSESMGTYAQRQIVGFELINAAHTQEPA